MEKELVASDASTLMGLASAGAFDLLHQLFGQVAVTATVRDEVLPKATGRVLESCPVVSRTDGSKWGLGLARPTRRFRQG